ncbi:unnamed protein product [Cochlearia groenlandica]
MADIEEILLPRLVSTCRIGHTWSIQAKENLKTSYRHAVPVWSGRYRGKDEEALISTCGIGLAWSIRRKRSRSKATDQHVSTSPYRFDLTDIGCEIYRKSVLFCKKENQIGLPLV